MTLRYARSNEVLRTLADGVLTVTIDREAKRNPLSLGVLERLREIFAEAATDEAVRVAVVTGAGGLAFASGGDLAELNAHRRREDAEALSLHGKAALEAIRQFPVPVIARLNGLALGGGAELALACDQRLAAAQATIGFIHARLAIAPSWGGSVDLVRTIGPARALRLMATGEVLSAEAALALGLVDAVCPEGTDFDGWFDAQLAAYRDLPRHVARACKALAGTARGASRAEADQIETRYFTEVWSHPDHWEAVARRTRKLR